jgi:hypothetical protein
MHYDDGRSSQATAGWHQVTGVYDAATATISIYVDGAPQDVEHVTAPPVAHGPLVVGAGVLDYLPRDAFLGDIDELRTYGRALSPLEAWQLYRAGRGGPGPAARLDPAAAPD